MPYSNLVSLDNTPLCFVDPITGLRVEIGQAEYLIRQQLRLGAHPVDIVVADQDPWMDRLLPVAPSCRPTLSFLYGSSYDSFRAWQAAKAARQPALSGL